MLLYSMIMFIVSFMFCIISYLIYKGNTNLIHDYHQTKVKDKKAYGQAFGKALFVFALSPFISGVIGLFGDTKPIVLLSVFVLIIGMIVGIIGIIAVQKKYNHGIF